MDKLKILILMSRVGGGHTSVAYALQQAFEARGHEVVSFDATPRIIIPTYGILSRHFLSFWGFLFWTSNEERTSKIIAQLGNKIVASKVVEKVKREVPDFVISDHWMTNKLPDEVFLQNGQVPLGVVVVDPVTVHSVYFKGHPDIYFIPTDYVRRLAIEARVPEKKLMFTGYPVRHEFYEKADIKELRKSLGLEPEHFIIMIGGSSEGVGKIDDLCDYLALLPSRQLFQAIIVCGRNKALFRKLSMKYYYDTRFKILGFERRMADYVRASNVVVSKAGPTNLYEAVAAKKPFLAFGCMPGQEEGNLEMIKREKIGVVEEDIEKVFKILRKWIKDPKQIEAFSSNVNRVWEEQKDASDLIVKYVEGYGNHKRQ